MKIVFLCGSLEPGADGVGDYVRILATELASTGHKAVAVALNDIYLSDDHENVQELQTGLTLLRMPSCLSVAKRLSYTKKRIDNFDPDWISLQFVPYAFNKKGLPFYTLFLKKLAPGKRVHIMFHETWVGPSGLKQRLLSAVQKLLIKKLLHSTQPFVIHTNLPVHLHRLQKLGFGPKGLPLFSNINVENKKQIINDGNVFRIGFFSQFENSLAVTSFLNDIGEQAIERKMQLEVILMGGCNTKMEQLGNKIEQLANYRNCVRYLGFLSTEKISESLQSCSLGITTVPRHALGKSGSAAAFLAHGIPVAAPNVHKNYLTEEIGFFAAELSSSILLKPDIDQLPVLKIFALKAREMIKPSAVTQTFLYDLDQSIKNFRN